MARQIDEHGGYDVQTLVAAGYGDLVHSLIREESPAWGMLPTHVTAVATAAASYRLVQRIAEASHALTSGVATPGDVIDTLTEVAEAEGAISALPPGYRPFREWADTANDSPRPWVIPGVLRRTGRLVIVAPEGYGKSALSFQVATCAAAGIHPFRFTPITPQRVLVVDAENDPTMAAAEDGRISLASPRGLMFTADRQAPEWDASRLAVWSRLEGIDLRTRRDLSWLTAALRDHRPDLLIAGPLYKLFPKQRGEDDEQLGVAVQRTLDRIRVRHDVAVWLEHHAPKGNGQAPRKMDPFGSSLWYRWPDIGIAAEADGMSLLLGRFRGDRFPAPGIPDRLDRGQVWPWSGWWSRDGGAWPP